LRQVTDVYWRDSQQHVTECQAHVTSLPATTSDLAECGGRGQGEREENSPLFAHALSGAASFAACLRLFRSYPLAVSPCYAGGWQRSIILRHRGFEGSGCYVLTHDPSEHFTLRPWHPGDGDRQEIRPGAPVSATSHRVITEGMPVPRDGALLGWVSDRQATVLLSVHHGQPGQRASGPQVRALPMVGSEPMRWPPFTTSPLDDGRLWEYVDRGELVDLAPLVAREAGAAFWVPSQHPGRARLGHGCVVVGRSLQAEEYWVPPGIYMDHWMLREGVPAPPATHLLTLQGTTDLARRLTVG
jgi:hypothetical protein